MPTAFTTDTFTATAGTNLSAHTPDSGGSWAYPTYETTPAMVITAAGRVRNNNAGQSTAMHSVASSGNAVTVTWDLYVASLQSGFVGVGVGAPSQATYGGYEARYDVDSASWQIRSFGSGSVINSISFALTVGQTYHCQFEVPDSAVSATKTLFVNGTALLTATDSAVATAGRLYIDANNSAAPTDSTGLHIDNINIYNSAFTPGSSTLAPDAAGIVLSPANQYIVAGTSLEWIHTATSAKFNFTGTSLSVNIDLSLLTGGSIATGNYPYLNWSIDGGAWQRALVASTVALATSVATGAHTCEIRFEPSDESDTWTPHSAIRITGWSVDSGSAISAPTNNAAARSKQAMLLGDSITRGYAASNAALSSYGPLLGHALDAEIGIAAYSGQGWGHAATAVAPAFPSTFGYYDASHVRTFPALDYLIISQGTNDAATTGLANIITSQLATMRAAVGNRTLIVIVIPPNGQQDSAISTGVTHYMQTYVDSRVALVDLSNRHYGFQTGSNSAIQYSVDGVHPTTEGHALLAADIAGAIKSFEASTVSAPHLMGSSNTVGGGCLAGL